MRVARLPATLAISPPAAHRIVVATQHSRSYEHFCNECAQRRADARHSSNGSNNSNSSSQTTACCFRLHHLLPCDWAELLMLCRAVVRPTASYTLSSPGSGSSGYACASNRHDGDSNSETKTTTRAVDDDGGVANEAVMHIVERVRGDFVPNNAVYYHLRRYCVQPCDSADAPPPPPSSPPPTTTPAVVSMPHDGESATRTFARRYAAFVRALQHDMATAACVDTSNKTATTTTTTSAHARADGDDERARVQHDLLDSDEGGCHTAHNCSLPARYATCCAAATTTTTMSATPLHRDGTAAAGDDHNSSGDDDAALHFVFYPHRVGVATCVPYCSRHFAVLVNLKPIVPLHLLVVPLRCVRTLCCLTDAECDDWGRVVALTLRVLKHIHATSNTTTTTTTTSSSSAPIGDYSIAIQQGALAGQTVPHLHTHIIPFDPRGRLAGEPEPSDDDDARARRARTAADMHAESAWLRPLFASLA